VVGVVLEPDQVKLVVQAALEVLVEAVEAVEVPRDRLEQVIRLLHHRHKEIQVVPVVMEATAVVAAEQVVLVLLEELPALEFQIL
jgi:hypothetical protein